VRTLRDWEQRRRNPNGAAKTLIAILERHPDVLKEIMLINKISDLHCSS